MKRWRNTPAAIAASGPCKPGRHSSCLPWLPPWPTRFSNRRRVSGSSRAGRFSGGSQHFRPNDLDRTGLTVYFLTHVRRDNFGASAAPQNQSLLSPPRQFRGPVEHRADRDVFRAQAHLRLRVPRHHGLAGGLWPVRILRAGGKAGTGLFSGLGNLCGRAVGGGHVLPSDGQARTPQLAGAGERF